MSEGTIDSDRILERIRRLLALSHSSNEHEAAAAAAKAQALLLQHNLALADVPVDQREADPLGRDFVDTGNSASWVASLLGGIAKGNFCTVINHGGGRLALIGKAHNVEVVRHLFEYLQREINRLADQRWLTYEGYESSARRWKTGFRHGAARTIRERLAEAQQTAMAEAATTRALVVTSDAALAAYVADLYTSLRTRRVSVTSSGGYAAGRAAGAGIALNRVLPGTGGGSRRLLS